MTKATFYVLVLMVMAAAVSAQDRASITPRASQALQSDSPAMVRSYWLFLDETAVDTGVVQLTDRARKRRAKADPGELLLDSMDARISISAIEQIRNSGVRIRHVSRWFKAVSVEATPAQIEQAIQLAPVRQVDLVSQYDLVPRPEPSEPVKPQRVPTGAAVELDYGISITQNLFVKAVKMHRAGYTGKGVLIAMFDTGFDTAHVAFDSTSILTTWDFINGDANVAGSDCLDDPQDRHGTLTFGAAGGFVPGSLIGVAFDADFALAKTEITCGGTEIKVEEDNWIAAAEWADSIGADIISASLGYYIFQDSGSYTMDQLDGNTARITIAADIAASKNILVCSAAGNERNDAVWPTIIFPADGDSVLAVGATRPDSTISNFSSPGPSADGRIKPDIVTMGQSVYTAAPSGVFTFSSGTSLSTPLVAGGAALAFDSDSTLTAMQLLTQIRQTGSRADNPDNDYGYGLMDAARAANILRVLAVDSTRIDSGATVDLLVQTTGRATEVPVLTAFGLPTGVVFVDSGNGRGTLQFPSDADLLSLDTIGISAAITNFADTSYMIVTSAAGAGGADQLLAYPNPFEESLTLAGGSAENPLEAVAVFNSAGEKVWERVNISPESSDTITIEWDGRNSSGEIVAPGVYVVFVQTHRSTGTIKVLKVR